LSNEFFVKESVARVKKYGYSMGYVGKELVAHGAHALEPDLFSNNGIKVRLNHNRLVLPFTSVDLDYLPKLLETLYPDVRENEPPVLAYCRGAWYSLIEWCKETYSEEVVLGESEIYTKLFSLSFDGLNLELTSKRGPRRMEFFDLDQGQITMTPLSDIIKLISYDTSALIKTS